VRRKTSDERARNKLDADRSQLKVAGRAFGRVLAETPCLT